MKKPIIFSSYDSLHHPLYAGGGARAIHEIAKELSHDYTVKIIAAAYQGSKNKRVDGVNYQFIGHRFLQGKLGHLLFHFLLPWYVRRESFAIWFENFTPPFSTSCLQLFTDRPVVGVAHMLSGRDMRRKYKIPFEIIERWGLQTYRYIIAPTRHVVSLIRTINPRVQLLVIPNAFSLSPVEKTLIRRQPYFLYLGRIEVNQKGIDLLLQAFALVTATIPHQLVIAGSGTKSELRKLQRLIVQYHLEKKIILLGRVEASMKATLLANATAIVTPSRFETFGISSLEAFASRKTVIVFAIKQLSWIPKAIAYKVAPFNVQEYAKTMIKVAQNPVARAKQENAAFTFSRGYTWPAIAAKYQHFIEKLITTDATL